MQATPSALLLTPLPLSIYFLCIRLKSAQPKDQSSYPDTREARVFSGRFLSTLWIFSLGVLSAIAGSLGLAAGTIEKQTKHGDGRALAIEAGQAVVVALIKFQLLSAILVAFSVAIPTTVISHCKILMFNIVAICTLTCAVILNILSSLLNLQKLPAIIPQVIMILVVTLPLPIIAAVINSTYVRINFASTHFWLVLAAAQFAATLSSSFSIAIAAGRPEVSGLQIAQTVFFAIWMILMMVVIHILPGQKREPNRASLHMRSSKSPTLSHNSHSRKTPAMSIDTSDFLNLHDPFASPPPCSPNTEKIASFSYFGPHTNLFSKSKKAKSKTVSSSPSLPPPHGFSSHPVGPLEDVDFDQEEAMLSQLLLRTLNSDLDISSNTKLTKNNLEAVNTELGLALDIKREKVIIVTCERRGSESTLAEGSHPPTPITPNFPMHLQYHPSRFTHNSTTSVDGITLYEPSSPHTSKECEKALPELIAAPRRPSDGSVSAGRLSVDCATCDTCDTVPEVETLDDQRVFLQALDEHEEDNDSTPRAQSPS